jgi:hypothetical protein
MNEENSQRYVIPPENVRTLNESAWLEALEVDTQSRFFAKSLREEIRNFRKANPGLNREVAEEIVASGELSRLHNAMDYQQIAAMALHTLVCSMFEQDDEKNETQKEPEK